MNYTHTKTVLAVVEELLKVKSRIKRKKLFKALLLNVQTLSLNAAQKVETDESFRASDSESEYINALKEISLLSEKTKEEQDEYLLNLLKRLQNDVPKFKAAFYTQEYYLWPSFESIYREVEKKEDAVSRVVYVYDNGYGAKLKDEKYSANIADYKNGGINILQMEEFDMSKEAPDAIFYMKPYRGYHACPEKFYVNETEKHVKYTFFVSYCLDVQGGRELIRYFYALPAFYHMYKVIAYSNYYYNMMKRYGFKNGENAVRIGHPKLDCAYETIRKKAFIREDWQKKLAGKKAVLWNTHFTVAKGKGVGTFYSYKGAVLKYFKEHNDIALIWRPHPLFWEEIKKQEGYCEEEFSAFLREMRAQDNIIIDDSGDYRYSFAMSCALISDAATFLVEYGATGYPVLYTAKEDGEFIINEDYLKTIKTAYSEKDVTDFLDAVRLGEETENERRRESFKNEFGNIDGNNGKRIYEYARSEIDDDILKTAKALLKNAR